MPRPLRWATILLAALPACWVAWGIYRYTLDVPYYDQWHEARLVMALHDGTLKLSELWDAYNNHRLFFGRLIWLPLSLLTHWNTLAECWLSWGVSFIILAQWLFFMKSSPVKGSPVQQAVLIVGWAWISFSMNQLDRWLHGFHIQIPLALSACFAGYAFLLPERFSWKRFSAAAACGIVSSFTFSCGLSFWPSALPLILTQSFASPAQKRRGLLIWFMLAVLVFFFHRWNPGETAVFTGDFHIRDGSIFLPGILLYVGSVFADWPSTLLLLGTLATGYFLSECAFFLRAPIKSRSTALWISLGLLVLCTAALTGMARGSLGFKNFMAVRYAPIRNVFWVAVTALWMQRVFENRSRALRAALLAFPLLVFSKFFLDSFLIWERYQALSLYYNQARQAALAGDRSVSTMRRLHPDFPNIPREILPELEKRQLTLYRKDSHEPPAPTGQN